MEYSVLLEAPFGPVGASPRLQTLLTLAKIIRCIIHKLIA